MDLLEDEFMGPLYKSVVSRQDKSKWYEEERYSVSKINQILSFFLVIIWGLMIINTIYFTFIENNFEKLFNFFTYERIAISILFLTLLIFIRMLYIGGKTNPDDKSLKIMLRKHPLKEGFVNDNDMGKD